MNEWLPDRDHVARYVKPTLVGRDGSVDGSAFMLRAGSTAEAGLSVNWMEVFGEDIEHQLSEVRRLCRLTRSRNGKFATLVVGEMKDVAREIVELRAVHAPLEADGEFPEDLSHAEIKGLPHPEDERSRTVGDAIATCVSGCYPALGEQE